MKRREFIALAGGAAFWSVAARAQQATLPMVAFLSVGSPDTMAGRVAAFRKGLSETGYAESNVLVEYHWLGGQYEHLTAVVDDLIRRRVAVFAIPGSTPVSLTVKAATKTIPIVFGVAENPVTLGLVASLARPGGNATGVNFFAIETDAKRLGLMHDLLPKATRIAVLINPANVRYSEATSKSLEESARTLGVNLVFFKASTADEIDAAFTAIVRERADALFVATEAFFAGRGGTACRTGDPLSDAIEFFHPRAGSSRSADELRCQHQRHVSPDRHLYRQYPQGCQTRRPSGYTGS